VPASRATRGAAAEDAAVAHVAGLGMRVLDRNVRVGHLEIDIVACDGPVVVVIEVRTRGATAWQRALGSIDPRKRERLRRAAAVLWAKRLSKLPGVDRLRFDVASVDLEAPGGPSVEYLRAAFV
jgi:putative endonuclease